MAKSIKAIKCPHCGSTQATHIKEDYYKCNNCGTEYFLDNDDINVNVKYNYNRNPNNEAATIFKVLGIIGVVVILIFIILGFSICSSSKRRSKSKQLLTSYDTYESSSIQKEKEDPDKHDDYYEKAHLFTSDKNEPLIFTITKRSYVTADDPRTGYYLSFVNVLDQKALEAKEFKLDIKDLKKSELRVFIDGNIYVIINKQKLFKIDTKTLDIQDVTTELFSKQEVFSSGVANLEFVYELRGNGLKVVTNMGKEYFYYPMVDKVYTEKNVYDAGQGFASLLPGAKDVTYYTFTSKSDDFDEPIQLLKVVYRSNNGGPEENPYTIKWFKDYVRYGLITDDTPYTKQLFRKDRNRIVSYKDLTPGRIYFRADVSYYDDQNIIISYKPTVADDIDRILQCLDVNTLEIKWTFTLDMIKGSGYIERFISFNNGYVAQISSSKYLIISKDGKFEKEINLR